MTKRLLVAAALPLLLIICFEQGLQAQSRQIQQGQGAILRRQMNAPLPDLTDFFSAQSAQSQPAASNPEASSQAASAPASKTRQSSPVDDRSSTVGDPVSSGPLTVKGKFRYFAIESFRPGIYPVAAFYDGLTMLNPPKAYPREWRQGIPAFARNYGDFMASWASVQGGKFVAASLLHEDPRYFSSRSRNFFARTFNAVRFAVIDRGDNGHPRLALANVAGAFSGGFVGNGYLPDPYADFSHGLGRSALALSGFVTSNLADEFRPEIRKVIKKLHLPLLGY